MSELIEKAVIVIIAVVGTILCLLTGDQVV